MGIILRIFRAFVIRPPWGILVSQMCYVTIDHLWNYANIGGILGKFFIISLVLEFGWSSGMEDRTTAPNWSQDQATSNWGYGVEKAQKLGNGYIYSPQYMPSSVWETFGELCHP